MIRLLSKKSNNGSMSFVLVAALAIGVGIFTFKNVIWDNKAEAGAHPMDKAQVEAIIKDYIANNPEAILDLRNCKALESHLLGVLKINGNFKVNLNHDLKRTLAFNTSTSTLPKSAPPPPFLP
jgi:hypothetical protein